MQSLQIVARLRRTFARIDAERDQREVSPWLRCLPCDCIYEPNERDAAKVGTFVEDGDEEQGLSAGDLPQCGRMPGGID